MTLQTNPQLELASNYVRYTNKNVFLTGKAGTGKTTFLHQLKKDSLKRMVIVAPTGVAAINAGGVTIHSFFRHYSKFTGNIVNLRSNERQETNNGRGEPAGTRRIHADRERAGREPGGGSPGADNPTKSELPATAVPMVWQIKLSG